jgi:hypothetical protein
VAKGVKSCAPIHLRAVRHDAVELCLYQQRRHLNLRRSNAQAVNTKWLAGDELSPQGLPR